MKNFRYSVTINFKSFESVGYDYKIIKAFNEKQAMKILQESSEKIGFQSGHIKDNKTGKYIYELSHKRR